MYELRDDNARSRRQQDHKAEAPRARLYCAKHKKLFDDWFGHNPSGIVTVQFSLFLAPSLPDQRSRSSDSRCCPSRTRSLLLLLPLDDGGRVD